MADTSPAENGSNNVAKNNTVEVPSVYHGLSGLTNKDNTKNPESTENDGKMDESNDPGFLKSVNKVVIPKDLSLYPGFPDTEGMSKEDSDAAIITFWKFWRKHKYKQKEKAKKLAKQNEKRAAEGLDPLENDDESTAFTKTGFKPPGYPDTEGLEENEAKEKIKQFWINWRQEKKKFNLYTIPREKRELQRLN